MITCSLCTIEFPNDSDLSIRLERHTVWHEKAHVQKRNTTQGTPIFQELTVNGVKHTLTNDDKRRCK